MPSKLITAALLRKRKACVPQVEKFAAEWPDGMAVTVENLTRCRAIGLDVEWGARLLSKRQRASYATARAQAFSAYATATAPVWASYATARAQALSAYEAATDAAWAAYEPPDAAWAAYEAATDAAWATYEAATDAAWATYEAAVAPARATYEAAVVSALVAAWDADDAVAAPAETIGGE